MPREHSRGVPKRKQHIPDRTNQRRLVAAWQIRPADGSGEQRVANEEIEFRPSSPPYRKADSSGTMTRRVMHGNLVLAEGQHHRGIVVDVDRRQYVAPEPEVRCLLGRRIVEKLIFPMEVHRHIQRFLCSGNSGDVIDVRVGQKDSSDDELFSPHDIEQHVDFVARVDEYSFPGLLTTDDEAVLLERWNRACLKKHG